MNAFDKCLVTAVKEKKFVYDSKLYTKCKKDREIFFQNLSKALSKKFSKTYTASKVSKRWKRLRDYYSQGCRDKENKAHSSPIVAAVSKECNFLDGYVGKNNFELDSDTASTTREESDATNSDNELVSDDQTENEAQEDAGSEDEESVPLIHRVEVHQRSINTLGNRNSVKSNHTENIENNLGGLINPNFPKNTRTQPINKISELSPVLQQSLKQIADIIEKSKANDKIKARAQIVCKFLDELPREKQPACLQRLLKVFTKYE